MSRYARILGFATVIAVLLSVSMPSGSIPPGGEFPLAWIKSVWQNPFSNEAARALIGLPAQAEGDQAERGHYVNTAAAQGGPAGARRPDWQVRGGNSGVHSYDPATSKKLGDRSDSTSDLYENADGSWTRRQVAGGSRVNFKGKDGKYQPFQLNLVPASGQRVEVAASDLKISFASPKAQGGGGGFLPIALMAAPTAPQTPGDLVSLVMPGGEVFAYNLDGASLSQPVIDGNKALYRDALPNVDVELRALDSGVKEDLILKNAAAGASFTFPLKLKGLTPRLTADGTIELVNAAGQIALFLPKPYMEDSAPVDPSGEHPKSDNVHYELTTVDGGPAIRVVADQAWLNDPARVFPVRLDPTAYTGDMADVFVDDDASTTASTQNGNALAVGRYLSGGQPAYKARSFLAFEKFATDGFSGKRISGANLRLFLTWTSDCSTYLPFYVHRVTSAWSVAALDDAGLTAGPAYSSAIGSLTVNDHTPACTNTGGDRTVGKWVSVPLSAQTFYEWATGRGSTASMGLALTAAENTGYSWKKFTSANFAGNTCGGADCRPVLELTYADNAAPQVNRMFPTSGTQAASLTPQLVAEASDVDSFPATLHYNFEIFEEDSAGVQKSIKQSGWQTDRTWNVPAGVLKWGGRYRWQVTAHDGPSNNGLASYALPAEWRYVLTTPVPQTVITSTLSSNGDKGFAAGSGNYTAETADAQVPSVGPALEIRRSYNSMDPRTTSAFGAGWSSLVDSVAVENGALVTVTYPSGQEVAFGRNADGTFSAGLGRFATFRSVTGGYELVDKEGVRYVYTASAGTGRFGLSSVVDVHGNALTLTYVDGKVVKLASAGGRSLTLQWTGNRVSAVVTDPVVAGDPATALTWNYTYTGDQLTKVCAPGSTTECTVYSYVDVNPYATAIENAGASSYWRLSEAAGTAAASESLARMGTDVGTYTGVTLGQAGPFAATSARAAGFNGTSSRVSIPDKTGAQSGFQTISMWVKTSSTADQVLYGQSWDDISAASAFGPYQPVLYLNGGKLAGGFPTVPGAGVLGTLVGQASGRCIDVNHNGNANAEEALLWDCTGVNAQAYTLTAAGELKFTYQGYTRCLDVNQLDKGAKVISWDCTGKSSQKWRLTGDGLVASAETGLCIVPNNGGVINGSRLVTWPCSNSNTHMRFSPRNHTSMATATSVADGQWHHVALSAAGDRQALYLDGVEVANQAGAVVTGIAPHRQYLGAGFLGGGWPSQTHGNANSNTGTPAYFTGAMAEVAHFDRPLTAAVVAELYGARQVRKALSQVTRPSGGVSAKVAYDSLSGRVQQVTDANGGVWKLQRPTASGSSQVYSSAVLGAAPADYWRLNDLPGAMQPYNEISAAEATYQPGVTLGGQPGVDSPFHDTTAPAFDGASGAVTADGPSVDTSQSYSVSAWVRLDGAANAYYTAVSADGANISPFYLGYDSSNRWRFTVCGTDATSTACSNAVHATPQRGKWTHLVGTVDATAKSIKLYVDGKLAGTAAITTPWKATGPLTIGRNKWGTSSAFWKGRIGEVATFRAVLSADQISAQYAAADAQKVEGPAQIRMPAKTVAITDPGDKTISQVFNLQTGQQIADIDALGNTTKYGYDGVSGFMDLTVDPNGGKTKYAYDVRGNITEQTVWQDQNNDGTKATTYYTYFPDATTKVLTPDPRNDVMLTMRDGRSSGAADNRYLTTYTYDTAGKLTKVTDPLGRETVNTFTASGLPAQTTTPGGAVTKMTYLPSGDLETLTDATGMVTSHTYDNLGRVLTTKVTTSTFPAGLTSAYTYDKLGRVLTETSPATTNRVTGGVHTPMTTHQYDADGNETSVTVSDATGGDTARTVTFGYDTNGRKTSQTNAAGHVTTYAYDAYGNVIRETDPDGGVTENAYDAEGQLLTTKIKGFTGDPNEPTAATDLTVNSRAYDSAGRLVRETDAMGWDTVKEYTSNNLVSRVLRKNGAQTFVVEQNTFDGAGNLTQQVTNNGATTTTFTVDAAARQVSSTLDPAGLKRTTSLVLNPDDDVLSVTVKDGAGTTHSLKESTYDKAGRALTEKIYTQAGTARTVTFARDEAGNILSVTDPLGNVTNYTLDEAGQTVATTEPAVTVETYGVAAASARPVTYAGFNTFGEQTHAMDENGNVSTVTYDALGQVVSSTLPNYTPPGSSTPITAVTTKAYDKTGRVIKQTSPLGAETSYVYDQLDRVASVTAADTGVTKFSYDLVGDLLKQVDPTGAEARSTYDFMGRTMTSSQVVRQTGTNHTTTYGYATSGWPSTVTTPDGVATSRTYNAAGEVISSTDGAGSTTTFTYDAAGRQTRETVADGTYHVTDYDWAGQALTQKSYSAAGGLLSSTSQEFDGGGNVVSTVDARGTAITYTYDAAGQITRVTQPISATDSIVTTFGYDLEGKPTRFSDGRGHAFWTKYNTWGMPESQVEPGGHTYTTGYDADGRATSQALPGGVALAHTYDVMGRLTKSTGTGAEASTADRTFGYDLAGRMTSLSGSGGTNRLAYDDRGLLLSVDGPSGNSSFTYSGDGQLKTRTDAAGTTSYTYDKGRLASVSNNAGLLQSYAYNAVGQPASITYGTGGNVRYFGYDAEHRPTSDELKTSGGVSIGKITYGYDANANMTSKTTTGFAGSGTNTYTYDLANRLASWNGTAYAYDKSGNRTSVGSRTFTYNERNQLMTSPSDGVSYQYTPRGTLSGVVTGSVTKATLADAFGQVIKQYTSDSAFTEYAYDGLGRAVKPGFAYTGTGNDLASDGVASYVRDPSGNVAGVVQNGSAVNAWADLHTDLVGQFASTGTTLTGSRTFDPLGRVTAANGIVGNLGYQSEWTDSATGRVNMHARWYNPETAQFDTRDTANNSPIPSSINANRYQYGDGNPLTVTDTTGHWGDWIRNAWNKGTSYVSQKVNQFTSWAGDRVDSVRNEMRELKNFAVRTVKSAVKTVKSAVKHTVQKVKHVAKKVYNTAKKVYNTGKKYVAQKWEEAKQKAKQVVNKVKQAGKKIVKAAKTYVKHVAKQVKDDFNKVKKFYNDHKAEIVGFAAGLAVGIGCGVLIGWTGVGAVACGALAGAVGNMVTGAMNGHRGWDLVKDGLIGAATGALGGALGSIGGAGLGAGIRAITSGAGNVAKSMVAGAAREMGSIASGRLTGGLLGRTRLPADGFANGLFRKEGNTGAFGGLEIPMQKRAVQEYAKRAGVDLSGVKVTINRDAELIGKEFFGHTPNAKGFTLYPDAFSNAENLVKTIGHEMTHVMQYRILGPPVDHLEGIAREKAARGVEGQFWDFFNG